jgi:hypothetical protein
VVQQHHTKIKRSIPENQNIKKDCLMFNFIVALFLIALFILPVIGFVDGLGYKKMDNEYLDSARWSDGK